MCRQSPARVKRLIDEAKCDINAVNNDGVTPLAVAVTYGCVELFSMLLPDSRDGITWICPKSGSTLLHLAISANHTRMVALLLKWGADLKAVNKKQETPLHLAAAEHNRAIVKLLLDAGADANTEDEKSHTAFEIAVENYQPHIPLERHHRALCAFLEAGADMPFVRRYEALLVTKVLYHAAITGDIDVINAYLKYPQRNIHVLLRRGEEDVGTPLAYAVEAGQTGVVEILLPALLKRKCDIHLAKPDYYTPFWIAAAAKRDDIVAIFLKSKVNLNTPSCFSLCSYGISASLLHGAVRQRETNVIQALLKSPQSNINVRGGPWQCTPLSWAVHDSKIDDTPLKLLLNDARIDMHAQDGTGLTPFLEAFLRKDATCINAFFEYGVDINTSNEAGDTPLFNMVMLGQLSAVDTLLTKGATILFHDDKTTLHVEDCVGPDLLRKITQSIHEKCPYRYGPISDRAPALRRVCTVFASLDHDKRMALRQLYTLNMKKGHVTLWESMIDATETYLELMQLKGTLGKEQAIAKLTNTFNAQLAGCVRRIEAVYPMPLGKKIARAVCIFLGGLVGALIGFGIVGIGISIIVPFCSGATLGTVAGILWGMILGPSLAGAVVGVSVSTGLGVSTVLGAIAGATGCAVAMRKMGLFSHPDEIQLCGFIETMQEEVAQLQCR